MFASRLQATVKASQFNFKLTPLASALSPVFCRFFAAESKEPNFLECVNMYYDRAACAYFAVFQEFVQFIL